MAANRTMRRNLSRLAGGVFGLLLILGFVWFVHTMMAGKTNKSWRQVQIVQVIRPPPPPPDQPPPPPPEKTEVPLPKDVPEPVPDNQPAPADQPLGLDAEGAAGGDAFGLAARRGGSDLLGGTGTAPFAWYTSRITDAIRERLSSVACAKSAKGSLSVHVMLEASGRIKQVQLATTTGNPRVDQCIDTALTSMPAMSDPLPPGMPEQVNLKIVSRI
ncbi:MAG TPA: TonB C-terminal domain-containing protein [Steroidobacteraceae bacterium]|jgi:protein TonB